jgi:ribosomal protein L12E/L44/L45/RPP1/RPP2
MSGFEAVTLKWKGQAFTIPPHRVLGAIACIEEHLTLDVIHRAHEGRHVPAAKVSLAFAAVLRYAGAAVEDVEVYTAIFQPNDSHMQQALTALLMMMVPPSLKASASDDTSSPQPAQSNSSAKRTKRSSGRAG